METFYTLANTNVPLFGTIAFGVLFGVLLAFGVVSPPETYKGTKTRFWMKTTLYFSAFVLAPVFTSVAIMAAVMGEFRPNKNNWKLALAVLALLTAIFK